MIIFYIIAFLISTGILLPYIISNNDMPLIFDIIIFSIMIYVWSFLIYKRLKPFINKIINSFKDEND